MTPSGGGWTENTLYSFQGAEDGEYPVAGVAVDAAGNLYGGTQTGSDYELSPAGGGWRFTVLYTLNGEEAFANLSMDASGNFYDTTWFGGGYGFGAVFKLTNSGGRWTYTSLHDFTGGSDGWDPLGNVLIDGSGNLYGTTSGGGFRDCESWGCGVVWEITP